MRLNLALIQINENLNKLDTIIENRTTFLSSRRTGIFDLMACIEFAAVNNRLIRNSSPVENLALISQDSNLKTPSPNISSLIFNKG